MADSEKRLLRTELVKITRQLALKETTGQMAFDIIDWQASMIMDRDLTILDQTRTIERLNKEVQLWHIPHNSQGRVATVDCDPHTCEHAKENVNLKRTIERLNQEIAVLRGSAKPNCTEPTQDPNLSVSDTCDPDTCKHAIENKDKSKRLAYYENAHSPSSKNNLRTQQAKRDNRKHPDEYKTPGAKTGHKGTSHNRKPTETKLYKDTACPCCQNTDIAAEESFYRNITDIPVIPQAVTTKHVGFKHHCNDCEHEWDTRNQIPYTPGTEFGNNLLTFVCQCLSCPMTQGMIRGFFDFFGLPVAKSTINNAIFALAKQIQKRFVEKVWKKAVITRFVKFDETPFKVIYKLGYVWICVTDTAVLVVVANTRAAIVLDKYFAKFKGKPKTVDGYAVYPATDDTQRCWDHFKRDSENVILYSEYPLIAQKLHNRLMKLYHIAKGRPPGDVSDLIARTLDIADEHEKYGHKFATKLRKAAPYLYTFVNHPGMDPTNNEAERYMRPVAIRRHISLHFTSEPGMEAWSSIWTFVFTCRKQGKSIKEECLKILSPTFE